MKKFINKLSFILVGVLVLASCEGNDIPTIDVENARAIASFNGVASQKVVFDPSANTENVIKVGVSTVSNQDRQVTLVVDQDATTLPSEYYTISTLNPVIPAGEFTTDIVITTVPGTSLPAADGVVVLELVSVENAEILEGSIDELTLGLNVQCPEVDMASIPGNYAITYDGFGTYIDEGEFEIVAGPGENEFTMLNPFGHPENYDVVFSVNPETGAVTVAKQAAWHCANFGCAYGEGRVQGPGQALTCIEQIDFNLTHTVDAGSFGTYALQINKI